VFGTEKAVESYRIMQGILGPTAHLKQGSKGAMLHGEVERAARAAQINTFGGGVNEVGRQLIASAGLGLVLSAR
jgi:alkylation response protein AidB-like acyl-CoA dehydrogenase